MGGLCEGGEIRSREFHSLSIHQFLIKLRIMSRKSNNNGRVPLQRIGQPWSMTIDAKPPRGSEFERFCDNLSAFLCGYFSALGIPKPPVYCQGDFFGERTEAIHFYDENAITSELIQALQNWLAAPCRNQWRIVIPARDDQVIYPRETTEENW